MRSVIKIVFSCLLLMLLLLSFAFMLSEGAVIEQSSPPVIYYHTDQPLTMTDVTQFRNEDADAQIHVPFTACGTLNNQSVMNPDLGRSSDCSILYISGDSSLMVDSSGGSLFTDDRDACILSTGAALELFGERYVSAGTVQYNEKAYRVRGVFDYQESIVIVPAASLVTSGTASAGAGTDDESDSSSIFAAQTEDNAQNYSFTRLVINPTAGAQREEMIQIFENRTSSDSSDKADCITYTRLAEAFMALLPLMILAVVMFRAIRFCFRNRYKPFWLAGGLGGLILMFWLFFQVSGISLSIPPDMIPNRWSDFGFWGNKISAFRTAIAHILFMNKSEVELVYYRPLASIAGISVIMVILFLINVRIRRGCTIRNIPFELIAAAVTELVTVIIIRRAGWQLESIRALILIWPYFIISLVFISGYKKEQQQ